MGLQVVEGRKRGFVSLAAHPAGCEGMVRLQAEHARRPSGRWSGGNLLVVGASTGYGLASRIAGAFGHGMDSVGVFYGRPPSARRTASPGWYNTAAFDAMARSAGLRAFHVDGDAFSAYVLERTLETVQRELGQLDVVVYSLAAPRRTDPLTGSVYRAVLKTIGRPMVIKSVGLDDGRVHHVSLEAAAADEIDATVAVMGGADLRRWVRALVSADLLAPEARVVAYSYIGPQVTWPVYRHGTIGRAKVDLEETCADLHDRLAVVTGGSCRVAICKSIVSQASSAIPAVPLYMSLLFRVMKEAGTHEGPIEQMVRLFDMLAADRAPATDEEGRIRLDEAEMQPEIQDEVMRRWHLVDDANLRELSDYEGFRRYFDQLFGFQVPGVDYAAPVETDVDLALVR